MGSRIFDELSRRRVFRGAAIYIFVAWAAVRVVEHFSDPYDPLRRLAVLLAIGLFPLAVAFSWVFRVTPGVVEREHKGAEPPPHTRLGRLIDLIALGGVIAIVVVEVVLRLLARAV